MSKAKAKPPFLLKIQSYTGHQQVRVWLVEVNGPTEHSRLHGIMYPQTAGLLAEALAKIGIPTVREYRPAGQAVVK